jgi:hypothetical protein
MSEAGSWDGCGKLIRLVHHNRFAALILGAWLAGSMFMIFLSSRNFQHVDEVLKSAPPLIAKMSEALGPQNSRVLLRHLVTEQNRYYLNKWEQTQLFLGALLTGVFLLLSRNRLLACFSAAMLLLVILGHYKITPELDWLGANIEFLPSGVESTDRDHFWKLHTIYGVLEAVKLMLGLIIASVLFTFSHRRLSSQTEVNISKPATVRRF